MTKLYQRFTSKNDDFSTTRWSAVCDSVEIRKVSCWFEDFVVCLCLLLSCTLMVQMWTSIPPFNCLYCSLVIAEIGADNIVNEEQADKRGTSTNDCLVFVDYVGVVPLLICYCWCDIVTARSEWMHFRMCLHFCTCCLYANMRNELHIHDTSNAMPIYPWPF